MTTSTSRRGGRPDALSRLRSSAPPWIPATDSPPARGSVPTDRDERPRWEPAADPVADVGDDSSGPAGSSGDRFDEPIEPLDPVDLPSDRPESVWGPANAPAWLTRPAADPMPSGFDMSSPVQQQPIRRPRRRGPTVAPPAAIALVAVGVLACLVTAFTVLGGSSDDSPAAAHVAFPSSAGRAAPSQTPTPIAPTGVRPAAPPGSTSPTTPTTTEVVVSVVGLIRSPGLIRLPPGARVADAIGRAGGGRAGADLLSLNMAQLVHDGDQILVGYADPGGGAGLRSAIVSAGAGGGVTASGQTPAATTAQSVPPGSSGALVDLNTADEAALDSLPGVGPVTAKAIIDWRSRNGRFVSVDQLGEVDGIGPGRLAKLRDRVTV